MGKVIFENTVPTKKFILQAIGKAVDSDGYIYDKETGLKVVTDNGEEVTIKEFAGVRNGSEIFIKSDIGSIMRYVTKHRR